MNENYERERLLRYKDRLSDMSKIFKDENLSDTAKLSALSIEVNIFKLIIDEALGQAASVEGNRESSVRCSEKEATKAET